MSPPDVGLKPSYRDVANAGLVGNTDRPIYIFGERRSGRRSRKLSLWPADPMLLQGSSFPTPLYVAFIPTDLRVYNSGLIGIHCQNHTRMRLKKLAN